MLFTTVLEIEVTVEAPDHERAIEECIVYVERRRKRLNMESILSEADWELIHEEIADRMGEDDDDPRVDGAVEEDQERRHGY